MIISRTPYRISLFGGGTDYNKWYESNNGVVISTSINKYSYITIRKANNFFDYHSRIIWSVIEEVENNNHIKHPVIKEILKYYKYTQGLEIHYDGDLPARSGLGSSSSFTVGFLNSFHALIQKKINKRNLTKEAIFVEQKLLKESVGIQDQIQVSFGGFNLIKINKNGNFDLIKFKNNNYLKKIKDHMLLFYTGISRHSSNIAGITINSISKKQNNLHRIMEIANEAKRIIDSESNITFLGELLDETWALKKDLHSNVSNSIINNAYDIAKKNGALGGKILGAGGGGHLLIFAKPHNHKKIVSSLKRFTNIKFDLENEGTKIIYQSD